VDDTVNANAIKELLYVRCGYMQLSILNSDEVEMEFQMFSILVSLCFFFKNNYLNF